MRWPTIARRRREPNGSASVDGAQLAPSLGLEVHAGHGLDFETAEAIAALPEIVELNIGHFLIGEAVFGGLADAVQACAPPWTAAARGRMIIGIGSDLIDVRRIERTIERHGERFLDRIFTAAERAKAEGRSRAGETYAKRFAAKEACAKALGTGLRAGVFWRDMGVVNLPSGRPTMKLTGGALARLNAITPAGLRGAHRRDHHRRRPDGAGAGGDLRGAARAASALRRRDPARRSGFSSRAFSR